MGFNIPKIFTSIKLSEYAPEFGEVCLDVYVNPPKGILLERDDIITEINQVQADKTAVSKNKKLSAEEKAKAITEIGEKLKALGERSLTWYTKVWYQDGAPLTFEDVKKFFDESAEIDPRFGQWLVEKSIKAIFDHRMKQKN